MSEIEELFEQVKQNKLDVKRFCKLSQEDKDKLDLMFLNYIATK